VKFSEINNNWKLLGAGIKAVSAGSKAMREAETMQKNMSEGMDEAKEVEIVDQWLVWSRLSLYRIICCCLRLS
jgi:hypothetical protein